MKKVLVSVLAAVMVLGSTMTVMAAPSASADDVKGEIKVDVLVDAIDETKTTASIEKAVEVKAVEANSEAVKTIENAVVDVIKAANTKADKAHTAEVVALADVKIPTATEQEFAAGIKISFAVDGIKEKDTIQVLHYNTTTSKWEVIEGAKVEKDGVVSATFKSLSPVAVVKVAEKAIDTGVGFSTLSLIAAAGLVGAVACGKKKSK